VSKLEYVIIFLILLLIKKMYWRSKICIGTAQLSDPYYGFLNKKKKSLPIKDFKKILKFAIKKKISYIDTALSYNRVDNKLSKFKKLNRKFKFITKIPKNFFLEQQPELTYTKLLIESKTRLGINKFYAVLLHDPKDLNSEQILRLRVFLESLKKNKITKKIGISIYSLKDFKLIKKYFTPELIQANFNFFDREFDNKSFIKYLKKNNILFFARSIFLQGVLLQDQKLPNFFKKFENFRYQYRTTMTPKDILTNRNFCPMPWTGVMYNFDGTVKNCIRSDGPIGDLKKESIESILLGSENLDKQQNIINRQPAKNCHTCYELENSKPGFDIISDRIFYIRELKKTPVETYRVNNFDLKMTRTPVRLTGDILAIIGIILLLFYVNVN
jgi:aryl-alcohol dehydrogenase-like predicted oxidoreductase